MRVQQIERFYTEAPCGFLGVGNHGFRAGIGLPAIVSMVVERAQPAGFSGHKHLVLRAVPRVQRVTNQVFAISHVLRLAGSWLAGQVIGPRRVKVTDPGIQRGMDGLDRLITIGRPPLDGERHRAHAESRNFVAGKCCRVLVFHRCGLHAKSSRS